MRAAVAVAAKLPPDDPNLMLNTRAAAEGMGTTPGALHALRKEGKPMPPSVKRSSGHWYRASDIRAWALGADPDLMEPFG